MSIYWQEEAVGGQEPLAKLRRSGVAAAASCLAGKELGLSEGAQV